MDVIPDKLRVKARWDVRSVTCMKRVISPISQRHSRRRLEAGYLRGSTVCTIKTIGRRMEPASPATFGGAPQIRRICIAPDHDVDEPPSAPFSKGQFPRLNPTTSMLKPLPRTNRSE